MNRREVLKSLSAAVVSTAIPSAAVVAGQARPKQEPILASFYEGSDFDRFLTVGFEFLRQDTELATLHPSNTFYWVRLPGGWYLEAVESVAGLSHIRDPFGGRRGFDSTGLLGNNIHQLCLTVRFAPRERLTKSGWVADVRDYATERTLISLPMACDVWRPARWNSPVPTEGYTWLDEHFPDWHNPLAYWD